MPNHFVESGYLAEGESDVQRDLVVSFCRRCDDCARTDDRGRARKKTQPELTTTSFAGKTPSGTYTVSSLRQEGDKLVLHTSMFDWRRNELFVLTLDEEQRLRNGVSADQIVNFESPDPKRIPVDFFFEFKASIAIHHYKKREEASAKPESDFRFPLAQAIESSAFEQSELDPSFMRERILCESGEFFVWYRMPAETIFFGYPIRAGLTISRHARYTQWYTNLVGQHQKFGRLHHPKLDAEVDDAAASGEPPPLEDVYLSSFLEPQFDPWAEDMRKKFDLAYARHRIELGKKLTDKEILEREIYLLALMQSTIRQFDQTLQDGHAVFLDPFIRGLVFEQTFWRPDQHKATMVHYLGVMIDDLRERGGTLSFSLLCSYAELGLAPNGTSHVILINAASSDTYQDHHAAALLARWRWPTKDFHVDAVVDFLNRAKHITDRYNCVETLFLMDRIDRVPPQLLEEWFERRVKDSAEPQRALNFLMQNRAGRAFLAGKYESKTSDSAFWKKVQGLFANEIRAVHQIGDYRFFSKEECAVLSRQLGLGD